MSDSVVLKFGGTSVKDAEAIKKAIAIIESLKKTPVAVVVSAMAQVTNALIETAQLAATGDESYLVEYEKLKEKHFAVIDHLVSKERALPLKEEVNHCFFELAETLKGVFLVKELTAKVLDLVMGFGERLSAKIISYALPNACFVDARKLIQTDHTFGAALVNEPVSFANLKAHLESLGNQIPIITGFIASTKEGESTTLGRGGSDLTASLVAVAIKAKELQIWTDVDGVMTADPRVVKQAFTIPQMTYNEMLEMSFLGAKVLHPPTVIPALKNAIPIRIKNTFHPQSPGTLIVKESSQNKSVIRGLSSIKNVALIRVEGSGMVGVCGVASRLFGALAREKINVIMISQCSSEHSICFAVDVQKCEVAKRAIEKEFELEIKVNYIDRVVIDTSLSVLAAVGENMRHTTGVAGMLFSALGKNGINVHAIAQGSSEYNITCVVSKEDEAKALNVIHESFFLSSSHTLHVFLVGIGLIGGALLDLIFKQKKYLLDELGVEMKVIGIANSQKMIFCKEGIDLTHWKQALEASFLKMDSKAFMQSINTLNLPNSCFVDCTASQEIADLYENLLKNNISIVTPNKKANASSFEKYQKLNALAKKKGVKFLYETNVGAGLPLISTIKDLCRSGDEIHQIEGVLSGSLSYLFNHFKPGERFSERVKQAQKLGFTEPDPREDLNGMDVVRKLLILARESGYALELDEIKLVSFLPKECFQQESVEDFYRRLEKQDDALAKRVENADQQNLKLRFIAQFRNGVAEIALKEVDAANPFYHLKGSDNMIAIWTKRYRENPMVISGQGAGAEVTSGEVFADMIRVAKDVK